MLIKFFPFIIIPLLSCLERPYILSLHFLLMLLLFHLCFTSFRRLFWYKLTQSFCKSSWRWSHTWVMSFLNIKFIFQTWKLISSLTPFRGFETPVCHLIPKLLGTRSPSFQPTAIVSGENFWESVDCGVAGKARQTWPLSLPTLPELPEWVWDEANWSVLVSWFLSGLWSKKWAHPTSRHMHHFQVS